MLLSLYILVVFYIIVVMGPESTVGEYWYFKLTKPRYKVQKDLY